MKRFLLLILCFSLGFVLGKVNFHKNIRPAESEQIFSKNQQTEEPTEIRQGGYQFINPLWECAPTSNSERELLPFKEKVEVEMTKRTETGEVSFISFYYRDLNNGPSFGINKSENFAPASLLKVPLMMAYLKRAESNPTTLFKMISYEENQLSLEINVPKEQQLEPGKGYPVMALIEKMITYSDNTSFELLSKNISEEEIEKIHRDIGITVPSKNSPENFISVQEYASLFRVLYNSSYLNREMSEKALEILSQTTFKEGIAAGIPKDITLSHKFGIRDHKDTREKQLHDCGIVYATNKPYLICIMTRGTELEKLSDSIKNISTIVYNNITK